MPTGDPDRYDRADFPSQPLLAVDGKVYDVRDWAPHHPGGARVLESAAEHGAAFEHVRGSVGAF